MFRLKKNFFVEGPPPPVKGKFFDTRFGLIHVQTGKKNFFCWGTPPSKGKIFGHQIWLYTCSDWKKKFFVEGHPPPVKGKLFDTRFGLIHVQTEKKNFCQGTPPRNSKKLLWPRGGRYASCVHAGGLSCLLFLWNRPKDFYCDLCVICWFSVWNWLFTRPIFCEFDPIPYFSNEFCEIDPVVYFFN